MGGIEFYFSSYLPSKHIGAHFKYGYSHHLFDKCEDKYELVEGKSALGAKKNLVYQ